MHNNITSTPYLLAIGVIITLLCFIYFIRKYGINFFEELNRESVRHEEDLLLRKEAQEADDHFSQLEKLINEIKENVLVQVVGRTTKEQLFEALSQKVASYDVLHQPAYRYALNNFIIQHSKILCGAEIREDELEALWNDLPR